MLWDSKSYHHWAYHAFVCRPSLITLKETRNLADDRGIPCKQGQQRECDGPSAMTSARRRNHVQSAFTTQRKWDFLTYTHFKGTIEYGLLAVTNLQTTVYFKLPF